ncbi:hypothetical protein ACFSTI_24985 [Rhizorhabdus histidinilytica]|uniref:Uncharacterized protein n=1 Tax=Rhizorhabdus histidinilytica TaxID=439228 RepID=A0A1T5A8C0_9SPHN|nr:hypothetical protein [Rhizorhabdus histidinilytica]SKB31251.1 hypothetical protein SAMN06295920_101700 [Rhizorhabdus histidinilytica]
MTVLPIIWTEADRLAAAGCAIILYPIALWFAAMWMLTRADELDPEDHDGLSDEQREALRIIREQGE